MAVEARKGMQSHGGAIFLMGDCKSAKYPLSHQCNPRPITHMHSSSQAEPREVTCPTMGFSVQLERTC